MTAGQPRARAWVVLTVLGVLLLVSAVLSAGIGSVHFTPSEILRTIWWHITGGGSPGNADVIVWDLRLPRIALALLVGASLSVAGVLMQSLFHNPMADPYVVGVSAGSALGAVLSIALGLSFSFLGLDALSLFAFIGGLGATVLVYRLARRGRRVPVGTLLLTGIAVGGLLQAFTVFLLLQRESTEMREVIAWLLGSLAYRSWHQVFMLLPYALLGIGATLVWQRELNVLALGDETAHHLGVNIERTKLVLLLIASLLTAAAVAVSGVIAFVGLIVPHLMRLIVGPNHRILLPASLLCGGLLLLWADVIARVLIPSGELPIGIVTSVLGSPFFLYLLNRREGRVF